jgi:hypothetical protein
MSLYRLFVPKQAVGANLIYFDLFVPTTSAQRVELVSLLPTVSGAVAVVGVVGVDLFLTRTTAVGTGGTAATFGGTALDALTFSHHDNNQPLTVNDVSARLTPTGGATAGAVLSQRNVFTEETADAAYTVPPEFVRAGLSDLPSIVIPVGTGIRVVQGAVASVGNIGFDAVLRFTPK